MADIKPILQKYNIQPNKVMGQNFLVNKNTLDEIIKTAKIEKGDTILEVGPGLGILTIELAKKAKKVIAIEKDKNLCEALQKILNTENIKNVEIVNKDILKISNLEIQNYKLVANIPYYLTSPLIRKFLETKIQPNLMVLMIQKEVAERIIAKDGKMSVLSVAVQFYAKPEIIDIVSKNCFYPIPKVDSAIIKLTPKTFPDIDTKKFFGLVRAGFSSKRKMLKNNLPKVNLEKAGLNPMARAENLSIDDWLKLFNVLKLS